VSTLARPPLPLVRAQPQIMLTPSHAPFPHRQSQLVLSCAAMYWLGTRAEAPAGRHPSDRVGRTVLVSLLLSSLLVGIWSLAAFTASGSEPYLYSPLYGAAPAVAVLAVLAHEVHGDSPVSPALPWLPFSSLPLATAVAAFFFSSIGGVSRDALLTPVAAVMSWAYLRFVVQHGDGGVGDARDEFEFLTLLPSPLRTPFRPFEKLLSAMLLPVAKAVAQAVTGRSTGSMSILPTVAPTAGASASSSSASSSALYGGAVGAGLGGGAGDAAPVTAGASIYGTSAGSASAAAAAAQRIDVHVHLHGRLGAGAAATGASSPGTDPVAERRREKALRALDKRLAELKAKMRTAGTVAGAVGTAGAGGAGASLGPALA
jgi:hypothetical protein